MDIRLNVEIKNTYTIFAEKMFWKMKDMELTEIGCDEKWLELVQDHVQQSALVLKKLNLL